MGTKSDAKDFVQFKIIWLVGSGSCKSDSYARKITNSVTFSSSRSSHGEFAGRGPSLSVTDHAAAEEMRGRSPRG